MKLASDLSHAVRSLLREPGFTVPAVLMLGLGLGATSAMFSLVNGILLKPLPYAQPDRLVSIREVIPAMAQLYPSLPVNARHFVEWRKSCPALQSMSVFDLRTLNLTGWGEPERLDAALVSANLFRVLGVRPAQGRDFRDDEEQEGRDTVAVLTDRLWRRRFHADPSLVGRNISLNGRACTVVGILAPDFRFPDPNAFSTFQAAAPHAEVFVPKVFTQDELQQLLGTHNYAVIARLRSGASREQAVAQLEAVQARMEAMAGEKLNLRALATPLLETVAGKSRRGVLVLMGAIAALLLIVCVNLGNLLLARSERRSREFAVRAALGATRGALIRHGLAESLLLAFGGGLLATGVAAIGIDLLKAYAPAGIPRLDEVALDGRVLGFAAMLVAAAALLFGFLPAWRASRSDPQDTLRSATRGATASSGAMRLRSVLVASEVGLSAALLILAGMLLNSFVRLIRADKGFRAPTVLAVDIGLSGDKYEPEAARDGFYQRLFATLATEPGVAGGRHLFGPAPTGGNVGRWRFHQWRLQSRVFGECAVCQSRLLPYHGHSVARGPASRRERPRPPAGRDFQPPGGVPVARPGSGGTPVHAREQRMVRSDRRSRRRSGRGGPGAGGDDVSRLLGLDAVPDGVGRARRWRPPIHCRRPPCGHPRGRPECPGAAYAHHVGGVRRERRHAPLPDASGRRICPHGPVGRQLRNLRRSILFRRAAHLGVGNPRRAGRTGRRSVRPDPLAGHGASLHRTAGRCRRCCGFRPRLEQPAV